MSFSEILASTADIIDEARQGRMFILVDDESRENEGDLVVPAQMAAPEAIAFMAKYGRGLICLALTRQRVERLGLPPVGPHKKTPPPHHPPLFVGAREKHARVARLVDDGGGRCQNLCEAHGPRSSTRRAR